MISSSLPGLPKVCVVVLNFNLAADTIECVESVLRSRYPNYEILIVDNASTDNSCRVIRDRFPDLGFIRNEENLGYAGGNNVGIRYALERGADYVLILNDDATVHEDAVGELVKAGEEHGQATIVAPKVYFYDRPDLIDSCGTHINWFRLTPDLGACGQKDVGQFKRIEEKIIFPGSALLLKRALFEQVGFLDEKFFLIHEDADICLRNRKKNFKNILVPTAFAYHKGSKTLSNYPFLTAYYSIRNLLYLAKIQCPLKDRIISRAGLFILSGLNFLRLFRVDRYEQEKIAGFFWGVWDYLFNRMGKFDETRRRLRGRYRFKRRWKRILMAAVDGIGSIFFSTLCFSKKPPAIKPKRILIVRIDSLGDGVLTLPAIGPLRKRFPAARIDFLVGPNLKEFYALLFPASAIHVFEKNWFTEKGAWNEKYLEGLRMIGRIRKLRYDLGIDFRGDFRNILLMTLAGIPHRWGRDGAGGRFLLTERLSRPYERHEVFGNLALICENGVDSRPQFPSFSPPSANLEAVDRWLEALSPFKKVVFHVGAGYPSKRWSVRNFVDLAKRIHEEALGTPIFIGTEGENKLLDPFRNELGNGYLDLTGKTPLPLLLALLSRTDLYIGNDSGPAHLAAFLDRKMVLVFSGTNDYRQWAPWASQIQIVRRPVPCSPCEEKICPLKHHLCMEGISVDEVFRATQEMLRT